MIERFRKASIRWQFIAVASFPIPILIVFIIAILPEPLIFYNEKLLMVRRTQIEMVVTQLRSARDNSDVEDIIRLSAPLGLALDVVSWETVRGKAVHQGDFDIFSDDFLRVLPADFEAVALERAPESKMPRTVAARLGEKRAVVIGFPKAYSSPSFFSLVVEFVAKVSVVMLPMLLLVLYMGRMITSPLVRFADAAKRMRLDDTEDELFAADGTKEIHTLAISLNNMRRRIRKMVDDRTRMLTAVSHDLRTPLTRLRMRVERSKDFAPREALLSDIETLTTMIEESLQYLSSNATAEPLKKVDVSSLLQTITSGFWDLGHVVRYSGPERFGYLCRQKALIRAITNIVENAVRFGTIVSIELRSDPQGGALIVVSDNGTGLAPGLQEKVLEPFFKADEARSLHANSGFGLGLSIADEVVKGHGGSLTMENLVPNGLRVTIHLPATKVVSFKCGTRVAVTGGALA